LGSSDFVAITSSDVLTTFELQLGGDILSVQLAVVPLEEGSEIFADEAHLSTKILIIWVINHTSYQFILIWYSPFFVRYFTQGEAL